jgi:hypothetical protein
MGMRLGEREGAPLGAGVALRVEAGPSDSKPWPPLPPPRPSPLAPPTPGTPLSLAALAP